MAQQIVTVESGRPVLSRRSPGALLVQGKLHGMTSIQAELWVDRGAAAVAFYQQAFRARVLHQVGDNEDIVAQLAVDDAVFLDRGGRREL
jgi:hypothetical protein